MGHTLDKGGCHGGEVEVTTMVRKTKDTEKSSDASKTDGHVEHALDAQEAEADAESGTESIVEENVGAAKITDEDNSDDGSSEEAASKTKSIEGKASNR